MGKIKLNWDEFSAIQEEIELLEGSEGDLEERDSFEKNYFELVGKARLLIKNGNKAEECVSEATVSLAKIQGSY